MTVYDQAAAPTETNMESMWTLMERLFPMHRTLVGPGFAASLEIIKEYLDISVSCFPSGMRVFDWVIPKAFICNEAYVEAEDGSRPIDFKRHPYHVWNYSVPFEGVFDRRELVEKLSVAPHLHDAVPLRDSYYKPRWGLSASQAQVDALKDGNYRIKIDTEIFDDYLRIGEAFLRGETDEEILINSYLCHPYGANDNLSGVVVAVELFKLLSDLPQRKYSYRLALWPETIGSITYIASYPERIQKTVGVLPIACCGDNGKFHYKKSFSGDTAFDRSMVHALKHSGYEYEVREYDQIGGDERQFNAANLRLACGLLTRTPANEFPEYHTDQDNLEFVRKEKLGETLEVVWKALRTMESNRVYKPLYVTEPFLSGHGIYPYDQGMGTGERGGAYNQVVMSYFMLFPNLDGRQDLLAISDKLGWDIRVFDRAISDLLCKGLAIETASEDHKSRSLAISNGEWEISTHGILKQ